MFHFSTLSNPALTQARTSTHAHTLQTCKHEAFSGHCRDAKRKWKLQFRSSSTNSYYYYYFAFKFPFSQLELSICKHLTFISLQINTRAASIKQSINSCWPVFQISIKGKQANSSSSEEVHSQEPIKSLMLLQLWMIGQNNNLGGQTGRTKIKTILALACLLQIPSMHEIAIVSKTRIM